MAQRIVAFLDVLGFKELVECIPHEELIKLYRELLAAGYAHTTVPSFPDDHRNWDEEPVYHDHEVKQQRFVNVVMASDSIIVFSDHECETGNVVSAVRRLLRAGFRLGLPLRGAIAFGDLDIVDATDIAEPSKQVANALGLVGAGLVRAYTLESKLAWSGAVLHPELVEYLENKVLATPGDGSTWSAWDSVRSNPMVTRTNAPLKHVENGKETITHQCLWAVKWPNLFRGEEPPLTESQVSEAFKSHGRDEIDDRVQAKREHTLEFWKATVP